MQIVIRRVRPSDDESLSRFYSELSPESLHARFLGATRGVSARASRAFCTLDHMHDEGFVALTDSESEERVVGHVCMLDTGNGAAEIGICVSDAFQGLGIGRRLFEKAVAWASERGYKSIKASCFASNSRVLALLSSAPHGAQTSLADGGTVEVTIPLVGPLPPPSETWPKAALAALARSRSSRRRRRPVARTWRMFWLPRPSPRAAKPHRRQTEVGRAQR